MYVTCDISSCYQSNLNLIAYFISFYFTFSVDIFLLYSHYINNTINRIICCTNIKFFPRKNHTLTFFSFFINHNALINYHINIKLHLVKLKNFISFFMFYFHHFFLLCFIHYKFISIGAYFFFMKFL